MFDLVLDIYVRYIVFYDDVFLFFDVDVVFVGGGVVYSDGVFDDFVFEC